MNDIAKTSIKDKLVTALNNESLSKTKAGELLGVKPQYLSMVLSPSQWNKFPELTWELLQKWVNSGQGLIEYSEKHGKVLPEKHESKPGTVISKVIKKEPIKEIKQEPKKATEGEFIDMLIEEKALLRRKIDAIDLLLTHYISV
jgi:predicted transcriptional regulator